MEWIFWTDGSCDGNDLLCNYCTLNAAFNTSGYTAQNGSLIIKHCIGKNVEESDRALTDVLFTHQFGQTVKIGARFQYGIFRI